MIGNRRKVPAQVGSMSLVGISGPAPHSWGNYFDIWTGKESIRIWNMWAENLQALANGSSPLRTLLDGKVEIIQYSTGAIVVDPRVPPEYLYNKLCFTGGRRPTKEEAREIYDILGDPNNEFEQFEDMVSYYAKRGSSYNPNTGIIKTSFNSKSRPLKATWTCEQSPDSAVAINLRTSDK